MLIGDPISGARKTLPHHGFNRLGGQARAVLLFAVSCCMSFPTCEAAPATDTTTAFALGVSTAIAELAENQVWTEKPDSDLLEERRNVVPFDRLLTFRAAVMVRYNVKGADFEALKKSPACAAAI